MDGQIEIMSLKVAFFASKRQEKAHRLELWNKYKNKNTQMSEKITTWMYVAGT